MRDLAKSMISWGWSMSVFSALQGARLLTPNGGANDETAADAFKTVTDAATPLLTTPAKMAWQAGLAAQNAVFQAIAKTTPGIPGGTQATFDAEVPATAGEPVPIGSLAGAAATKLDA